MSLRARFALVLGTVLLGPLLVAAVVLGILVPRAADTAGRDAAERDAETVVAALAARCGQVGDIADGLARRIGAASVARGARDDTAAVTSALQVVARRPDVSVVVLDQAGTPVAIAGLPAPEAANRAWLARNSSCGAGAAAATGTPAVLAESVPVTAGQQILATVVVWTTLDDAALRAVRASLAVDAGVAVLDLRMPLDRRPAAERAVLASTLPRSDLAGVLAAAADGRITGTAGGHRYALRDPGAGVPYAVLAAGPAREAAPLRGLALALILAAVLALLLVRMLAARLTRPLAHLTVTAEQFGAGDLSARSGLTGRDEVGRLAEAFDTMAERLEHTVGELADQRDLLSDTFQRFGEALTRTHDLDGLLRTVVAAALRGADAAAGAAFLDVSAHRDAAGQTPAGPRLEERVRIVEGVPGEAADALAALAARAAAQGAAAGEAQVRRAGPALALPLLHGDRVVGAVALVRPAGADGFDPADVERVTALAAPAGTAIANVRTHEETRRLSVTDPLTGAGNQRQLSTTLSREVERATRFGHQFSVLMLDLDHFKQVNDTLGHAFGDAVLREFARRLTACLREVDTVARYGGEEFAVILPETDVEGGAKVAERVLQAVRSEPFRMGDVSRRVTVSVGVAAFPAHGRTRTDLLRAADTALYAAKRAGRDQFRVAGISAGAASVSQAG